MTQVHSRDALIPTAQADKPAGQAAAFRKELVKIMPGYQWTVHRAVAPDYLEATGIQSSGFNRLSTLHVARRKRVTGVEYVAKSAGFGKRAPWLHTNMDFTLARALRGLQQHYEAMANIYRGHASYLQSARSSPVNGDLPTPALGTEPSGEVSPNPSGEA